MTYPDRDIDRDERVPSATPREGRNIRLAEVRVEAVEFLYQLAIDEEVGWRFRFAGSVPRRETFDQSLWNGVLTQFVVVEKSSGAMIGSVVAYNADLNHGFAYLAVGMTSEVSRSGAGIEAADVFLVYLFSVFRLRKIYIEVPEYNVAQFGSAIDWILKKEGVLRDHTFYQGRFWDRHIYAIYREDYLSIPDDSRAFGRRRRVAVRTSDEAPI